MISHTCLIFPGWMPRPSGPRPLEVALVPPPGAAALVPGKAGKMPWDRASTLMPAVRSAVPRDVILRVMCMVSV